MIWVLHHFDLEEDFNLKSIYFHCQDWDSNPKIITLSNTNIHWQMLNYKSGIEPNRTIKQFLCHTLFIIKNSLTRLKAPAPCHNCLLTLWEDAFALKKCREPYFLLITLRNSSFESIATFKPYPFLVRLIPSSIRRSLIETDVLFNFMRKYEKIDNIFFS